MNSAVTRQHLAAAERHVEIGEAMLAETRDRLHKKRGDGVDVSEAEATLALLEELQALRVAERDRLRRELEALH